MKICCLLLCLAALLSSCDQSPTGRQQVTLVPDGQMTQLGEQSFRQLLRTQPISDDVEKRAYVACITEALVNALREPTGDWSVALFQDPTPNAFALPGGHIGVNTGMLAVARTPDQLAAVIAHEIAHVIADHGNERLTQQLAVQGGLALVDLLADEPGSLQHEALRKALGLGVQYGLLLPYSRTHEGEADIVGRDLMAKAGFDPEASVTLWQNMAAAGGGQPLEFLSTHPSHQSRQDDLRDGMDQALALYADAKRTGRRPSCGR